MAAHNTADVARRAKQLYELSLKAKLESTNMDDFIAIEPDSGDYFFGGTLSEAIQAARREHPSRLAFAMRIGHDAAVQIGVITP